MEIRDRKLWERELTDHMRRHAADLDGSRHAKAPSGVWISAWLLLLWTITVVIVTSVGWAIGLYII
ncbi:MAG: hypothetical protein M3460_02065 [Actinomycetota bacterium]|nr:hypothetical protein [Actinomycetota bacterium]